MRSLPVFSLLLLFPSILLGQSGPIHILPSPPQRPAIEAGFEWGSLYQERFQRIGSKNFSYLLGFRGGKDVMRNFGIRMMGVHVQLTPARARNHQGIAFIEDPKEGLKGSLDADRLYFDIYPLRFGLLKLDSARYALRGALGVSPGLGYSAWRVRPSGSSTEYVLDGISLGLAIRARVRIMEHLFIEYPFFDLFTFLYKGPSGQQLGPAQERIDAGPIGLFSWGTIGISVPLE